MDGAYDDLAHARDASQRVDDVRGRVTVQAGGDLVAEQYRRVVQQLDGEGDLLALAARQARYARVQELGHAQRGHDAVHVFLQSRLGHVTVHFQTGLTDRGNVQHACIQISDGWVTRRRRRRPPHHPEIFLFINRFVRNLVRAAFFFFF